jgi:alpha-L-fucosidase
MLHSIWLASIFFYLSWFTFIYIFIQLYICRYGDVEEVWLDGAKGDDKKMAYMFDAWFALIHQLQQRVVIFSDAGPDTRWVGDESGIAGYTCWSLFNKSSVTIGETISE